MPHREGSGLDRTALPSGSWGDRASPCGTGTGSAGGGCANPEGAISRQKGGCNTRCSRPLPSYRHTAQPGRDEAYLNLPEARGAGPLLTAGENRSLSAGRALPLFDTGPAPAWPLCEHPCVLVPPGLPPIIRLAAGPGTEAAGHFPGTGAADLLPVEFQDILRCAAEQAG